MVPFAITQAERLANGDPRLSLQERYGTHDGYVAAVRAAADNAACKGYLNAGVVGSVDGRAVHDDAAARRRRTTGPPW